MSAGTPPAPGGRSGLLHLLGIDDLHGYLTPVWQSLVVGLAFVGISLLGYHHPEPRDVGVDIVGPAPAVAELSGALVAQQPGRFVLSTVAHADEGLGHLRSGETYAVLDLGPSPATLTYAGANGPTVTATLTRAFEGAVAAQGRDLRNVDAVALRTDDATGLPLYYLAFGVVLASYLFTVSSVVVGDRLPTRGHWTGSALLALTLGPLAAFFARYVTNSIGDGTAMIALLLALVSMATSTSGALFLHISRPFGNLTATIVLVILGSASGGVLPGEFLPEWLAAMRAVLPLGAALSGIRDLVYFGGGHVLIPLLVLVTWAVVPLPLVTVLSHRMAIGVSRSHGGRVSPTS